MLALATGAAVLLQPLPVHATGSNTNLFVTKTISTVTLIPSLSMTFAVDKQNAIPGDTLTYTVNLTNTGSTLTLAGDLTARNANPNIAQVLSYFDTFSTSANEPCLPSINHGHNTAGWTPVSGASAAQTAYTPVDPGPPATGMALTLTPVPADGVSYPTSGNPILGTQIQPGATADWHYVSTTALTPTQLTALADPVHVTEMRNTFHAEITPRDQSGQGQPDTVDNVFCQLVQPRATGAATDVSVTVTPPEKAAPTVFTSATTPSLASIAPGQTVSVTATHKVNLVLPKATGETDAAYLARLAAVEGTTLTASVAVTATGFGGPVIPPTAPPVSTTEHLPILGITKTGPTTVTAGTTENNPLALNNGGGAPASTIAIADTVPGGSSGTVSGIPATLAPAGTASPSAAFPVPATQPSGTLTDTAAVSWQDANGNPYGPVSSSFTTKVVNPFAGATLVLAPASAGPNTPGTSQSLTATLLDGNKQPLSGQTINFAVTGANPITGSAVTDANGNATFIYTGTSTGTDIAQATFTVPAISLTSNTSTITWVRQLQPVSSTVVTGNFFDNPTSICHFGAGPTTTPLFSQTFPNIMFNPDPAIFKVPPPFIRPDSNGVVFNISTRPFTDVTTDINGNPNGQIIAQGNGIQAGSSETNFFASFTGSFVVNQAGDVTFRILHDDGYILGVGGGALRVSGDYDGDTVPATTPFNNYPTMAAWNTSSTGSSSSGPATVHFPAAGVYPYELDYTECSGGPLFLDLLTQSFVPQTSPLSIYVGYADGVRAAGSIFPFPWEGSPGVIFEGCSGGCVHDSGAIRIDNSGTTPAQIDSVTVDIPVAPGVNDCTGVTHFDIWPHNLTIPAGQILILTNEVSATICSGAGPFDTSDTSFNGCGPDTSVIPVVNVTSGGVTTSFNDTKQILNTQGHDPGECTGNESESWVRIGGGGTAINVPLPPAAQLNLTPFNVQSAVQGQNITETVSALDGAGNPVPSLPVTLSVFGPNAQSQTLSTGTNGLVTFTYPGNLAGMDTVQATALVEGLQAVSNTGTITWVPPGGTNNPLGPTITQPTPADGSVITKPTAVDASIAAPSGHTVTSWRVFYQAIAGGPVVVIGSGTGAPPSPLGVTFDPTLLANGAYRLTVEATADDGAIQDVVSGVSVYGALKMGRYQTQFLDLAVPVSGFNMQVLRSYNSTDLSNGDFGIGWRVNVSNFRVSANHTLGAGGWTQYNKSCVLGLCFTAFRNAAPRFVNVVYPDGHGEIFDFVPDGGTNVFWSCTPLFKARTSIGSTSTLVPLDDAACSYTGDGNIYGSNGAYNPQRFRLTTRTGQVLVLDTKLGLVSMTDRNGNTLTVDLGGVHSSAGPSINFTRDVAGRITAITGPSGQMLNYTYSAAGDLASSTDPNGNLDTYSYDSNHLLLSVNGPQGSIASQTYDSSGRLVAVTDANHNTTQIQNDIAGQAITYTDALRTNVTVLTADDLGDVVRSDVTSGGVTHTQQFVFDAVGHPVQKTDADGNTVKATYDSQGNLTTYVDGLGNPTRFAYDTFGDVTSVTAPDGSVVVNVTYDASGNPTTILESGGVTIQFAYDAAGHITAKTDAAGHTTSYAYDAAGRMTQLTDAGGKSINVSYDASNRLTSVKDALGNTTSRTYDADGNVVGIIDARGISETLTYGPNSQVTSVTDPLGTSKATYDADGNLTSATDRSGATTTYSYDLDGRTTRIAYSDGDFLAYTFDGFGRPVTVANSGSSITNTYDAVGNLVSATTHAPAFAATTLSYTYDAAGNRLSSTGPDGTVSYAYNSLGKLVKVTDPSGGSFGLQYDSSSRLTTLTRPNGVTDSYSYDLNGKLAGIASNLGVTAIQNLSQTRDENGLVSTRSDSSGTTAYTHDANGRLVAVSGAGSASQAYTYDAAGNRTSDPQSSADVYGTSNQLLSDSNFTYTYDASGRLAAKTDRVSGTTTHYVWNGRSQLTSIQFPDGTTTDYTYDPLGRRLSATSGGGTTGYVYDGLDTRLEFAGGSIAASYVNGDQPDHPLEMVRGGAPYYYLQGFQGSITGLADSSGALKATYSYDAFGIPTGPASSLTNPFTYTGREYDPKSGLYFNRARYYNPSTGGFLSQDPVGIGQPYAYAAGDPVDFTDQGGAAIIDISFEQISTQERIPGQRAIGCAVAFFGAIVEIAINRAAQVPKTSDLIQMAVGMIVGCLTAALSAYFSDPAVAVLLVPIVSGIIASVSTAVATFVCGGQLDIKRIVAAGAAVLTVGVIGGMLGTTLGPTKTVGQFAVALLGALGTGILAGSTDIGLSPGGTSC